MGSMMGQGGMMGGYFQANSDEEMPIGPEQATEIANDYLGRVSPGTRAGRPRGSTVTTPCILRRMAR
jgi:hypothetical protein